MPSYLDYLEGGSKSKEWSITDVQCIIGSPIESCKGLEIDWNEEYAWQNLIGEMISTTEFLLVFVVQYLADQISENMTRSINACRCMMNSFSGNTWTLLAGTYQLLKLCGLENDIKGYCNQGYEYVCTCTYDATQLAKYMGASEKSSDVFSSCSESGSNKKIEDSKKKEALKEKKEAMAAQALKDAAALKVAQDIQNKMAKLNGCLKGLLNKKECRHNVYIMEWEAQMVHDYHVLQVKLSGGANGAKNQAQKDALEKSEWTRNGVIQAIPKILSFDYESDLKTKKVLCLNADGAEVEGKENCDSANTAIHDKLGKSSPPLLSKEAGLKDPGCYESNSTANAKITDVAKCALVPIANGLYQWKQDSSIKCADPFGTESVGFAKCFRKAWNDSGDPYKTRADNRGYDYPEYRTLGNDSENPKCSDVAKTKTIEGKDKCFPVWLGSTQKINDIDQYLWLSKENATCKNATGTELKGDQCAPSLPAQVCGSSAQKRITTADDAFGRKPYPVDQWKCYTSWTFKPVA